MGERIVVFKIRLLVARLQVPQGIHLRNNQVVQFLKKKKKWFIESCQCMNYDNLLKTLGSGSDSLADVYKRRQREEEEGKSDTEEDVDGGSESLSVPGEEGDGEEGTDNESRRSHAMGSKLEVVSMVGEMEQSEDDDEASDTDQEHLRVNGQSTVEEAGSMSSLNVHLGHKLSKADVDNLSKRKVPAVGMLNCKWGGMGECFLKDVDINTGYGLKLKLYKHWLDVVKTSGGNDFHSSIDRIFFSLCNSYQDILHYTKKPFYLKALS